MLISFQYFLLLHLTLLSASDSGTEDYYPQPHRICKRQQPPPGLFRPSGLPPFVRHGDPSGISREESSTLRRAARIGDLREGLSDSYVLSEAGRNRSLSPQRSLPSDLEVQGPLPTDLRAFDVPRNGYPVIQAVGLQKGNPMDGPVKFIHPEEISTSVSEALGLAGQDFANIVLKRRSPQCLIGDYKGKNIHPLLWSLAQYVTEAQNGYINEFAAIRLANGYTNGNGEQLFATLNQAIESGHAYNPDDCFITPKIRCKKTSYRTSDGTCNNPKIPSWGAAQTGHLFVTFPAFEDGIAAPREVSVTSLLRNERVMLPSAREVSLSLSHGQQRPDRKFTMMVANFGQFLAHDLTGTPIELVEDPKVKGNWILPACCNVEISCRHPSCFPITIPTNDPFYERFQQGCMEFVRAQPANPRSCVLRPRTTTNINTAFIDGSAIYGSNSAMTTALRGPRGTLKINHSPFTQRGAQFAMPVNGEDTLGCRAAGLEKPCMTAGDPRVNQHTGLVSLHSLFLRQHNQLAEYITENIDEIPDEVVYQGARRIVVAMLQHIVYNEFLPVLLGARIYNDVSNGISLCRQGHCDDCYDPKVNPSISVEFSGAAYRLHSIVPGVLPTRNGSGQFIPYHEHMLNPNIYYMPGVVDNILKGLVQLPSESFDPFFAEDLQNHLFQQHGKSFGQDLLSLDIQRGRDVGIPSYVEVRQACGFPPVATFSDLEGFMPPRAIFQLDFIAGAMSEYPVNGGEGMVGPTTACILVDQFARLRHGDRFWYENKESKFTPAQLEEIRKVSLSALLCANTPIEHVQPRAFVQDSTKNRILPCASILEGSTSFEPFLENLTPDEFPNISPDFKVASKRQQKGRRVVRPNPGKAGGPSRPGGPADVEPRAPCASYGISAARGSQDGSWQQHGPDVSGHGGPNVPGGTYGQVGFGPGGGRSVTGMILHAEGIGGPGVWGRGPNEGPSADPYRSLVPPIMNPHGPGGSIGNDPPRPPQEEW